MTCTSGFKWYVETKNWVKIVYTSFLVVQKKLSADHTLLI
jgi:hypothetical protein